MGRRWSRQRSRKCIIQHRFNITSTKYVCLEYHSLHLCPFLQKKLVSLQEATAAINTTVMSLQGECVKMSEQASILASVQQLNEKVLSLAIKFYWSTYNNCYYLLLLLLISIVLDTQMNEMRATDSELIGKLKQLEQTYKGLKNSTSIMFATVNDIQNQQQISKIKLTDSLSGDMTTEADRGATGALKSYVRNYDWKIFNYKFIPVGKINFILPCCRSV